MALTVTKRGDKGEKEVVHYTLVSLRERGNVVRRQIRRLHTTDPRTGHLVEIVGSDLPDYIDVFTGNGPEEPGSMSVLTAGIVGQQGSAEQSSQLGKYVVTAVGAMLCYQFLIGVFNAVANVLTN